MLSRVVTSVTYDVTRPHDIVVRLSAFLKLNISETKGYSELFHTGSIMKVSEESRMVTLSATSRDPMM